MVPSGSEKPSLPDDSAPDEWVRKEAEFLRQKVSVYIHGVVPCIVLYYFLAFQPWVEGLEHLRMAMFLFASLSSSCVVAKVIAGRCEAYSELKGRLFSADLFCLAARLLMHAVCIGYDDNDPSHIFLKLCSLWFLPLSAAKESMSTQSFHVYLFAHNALVLFRFWGHWSDGAAWIVGTIIVDRMLIDLSHSRHEGTRMRSELAAANSEIENLVESTTRYLFNRFCDATVVLDEEFHIIEPSSHFAAMLGIKESTVAGRDFSVLMEAEDVESFRIHMADKDPVQRDDQVATCVHPGSIQVRLLDAFAKPVPVHLLRASFGGGADWKRSVHLIGLSESWRPPKSKSEKKGGARRTVGRGTSGDLARNGGEPLFERQFSPIEPAARENAEPGLGLAGADAAWPVFRARAATGGAVPLPSRLSPSPAARTLGFDRLLNGAGSASDARGGGAPPGAARRGFSPRPDSPRLGGLSRMPGAAGSRVPRGIFNSDPPSLEEASLLAAAGAANGAAAAGAELDAGGLRARLAAEKWTSSRSM